MRNRMPHWKTVSVSSVSLPCKGGEVDGDEDQDERDRDWDECWDTGVNLAKKSGEWDGDGESL